MTISENSLIERNAVSRVFRPIRKVEELIESCHLRGLERLICDQRPFERAHGRCPNRRIGRRRPDQPELRVGPRLSKMALVKRSRRHSALQLEPQAFRLQLAVDVDVMSGNVLLENTDEFLGPLEVAATGNDVKR